MLRGYRAVRRLRGFNGAGMFLSRKLPPAPRKLSPSPRLQWGRDVSIPEMLAGGTPLVPLLSLQWGRDVSIPEILRRSHGFGGQGDASMGPGCFYPGNATLAAAP